MKASFRPEDLGKEIPVKMLEDGTLVRDENTSSAPDSATAGPIYIGTVIVHSPATVKINGGKP